MNLPLRLTCLLVAVSLGTSGCSSPLLAADAALAAAQPISAAQIGLDTSLPESQEVAVESPPLEEPNPEAPSGEAPQAVEAQLPLEVQPQAGSQPEAEPLRFVFPTQGPPPASAWRPPLYPTPWAPTAYDHFLFARPIAANEVNWPLADYRYGGEFIHARVHTGVDIPVSVGTPVLAAGSGRVTWTGYGLYYGKINPNDPYGLAVAIRHDFGYQGETLYTIYGHLSGIDVTRGQQVETGQLLGLSGDTGNTTGPHLHFEVRVGKNNFFGTRNPELWTAPPQGWGVLAARMMDTSGQLLPGVSINVRNQDTGQDWTVKSYGEGSTNSDPYYRENLVIGDLPAGNYLIWIPYAGSIYNLDIQIHPGLVSYFTFQGKKGYKLDLPPAPGDDFSPDSTR